ncbi:cytochrome P450 [Infundibulicybe gibba]|nr:cytochrome P450 [Infundibulicybe gibba]
MACPIYTLHRDSCNFKDPDLFQPERWLSGSLGGPHDVDAFFPFGYGYGVCIGKPVALHNMKFTIFRLLQTFSLSFSKGSDPRKFDLPYEEHNLSLAARSPSA